MKARPGLLVSAAAATVALAGGLALFSARTARRVEAIVPPQGGFIDVRGTRLHYMDRGRGPALVMIHGLAGQVGNFTHSLVDRLASDFRVIVVDRPGSGYSTRAWDAPATLGAQAETIAAFLDALGLERPLIVGHSLGGAVALALALAHPQRVAGLALIAPLTHVQQDVPAAFAGLAMRSKLLRALVAWTVAVPVAIRTRDAMLELVFAPDPVPADFGTRGGGLMALRPSHFYAASSDLAVVNDDLADMVRRYASLKVPVGVLFGRQDRILDPGEHGEALAAKIDGLRLTLTEGGHMLPVTAPDETADWIRSVARHALATPGRLHAADPRQPTGQTATQSGLDAPDRAAS